MRKHIVAISGLILSLMIIGGGCKGAGQTKTPSSLPVSSAPSATPPSREESSRTPTPSVPDERVYSLDITQWGVTLNLSADIADLRYSLKNDASTGNSYAYLSTRSLVAKGGKDCEAPFGPLGVLARAKEIVSDGPTTLPTDPVKVGDYYYYYIGPQATCSPDKAVQELAILQTKSVVKAATTAMMKQ